jgi:WD40 repeat protein
MKNLFKFHFLWLSFLITIALTGIVQAIDTLKVPFRTLSFGENISMAASGDGKRILITGGDGNVRLYELSTGNIIKTFSGKPISIAAAQFSPDGRRVALGFNLSYGTIGGGLCVIWVGNSENGDSIATFADMTSTCAAFGFSPNGSQLLVGLTDRRLFHLDSTLKTISTTVTDSPIVKIAFDGNGTRVLVHTRDSGATLLALPSLASVKKYNEKQWGDAEYFALSTDGMKIIRGPCHEMMSEPTILNAATGDTLIIFSNDTVGKVIYGYNSQIVVSPNGQMALASSKRSLKVWNIESGYYIATIPMIQTAWAYNSYLGFSPDNSKAISGNADTIWVWDIASKTLVCKTFGNVIGSPFKDLSNVEQITASVYKYGYSSSRDTVLCINLQNCSSIKTVFSGYFNECSQIAFSQNGATVFASGNLGSRIWETTSGKVLSDMGRIRMLPDLRAYLVSDGANGYLIKDFNQNTLKTIPAVFGFFGISAISSDYRIALAEIYDTLNTYDLSAGKKLCSIPRNRGTSNSLNSCALSPDGAYVVAGSGDYRVNVFNAVTGVLAAGKSVYANEAFAFSPVSDVVLSFNKLKNNIPGVWKLLDTSNINTPYNYSITCCPTSSYTAASFSPDGSKFVINNKLFETNGGALLKVFDQDEKDITCVNFSPDGSKIAIGSLFNAIYLWDIAGNGSKIRDPRKKWSDGDAKAAIFLLSSSRQRLLFSFPTSISTSGFVRFQIYAFSGRIVASIPVQHALMRNGTSTFGMQHKLAAGIYLYNFIGIPEYVPGSSGIIDLIY